jgi:DNA-binding SARP family transcriptional activator
LPQINLSLLGNPQLERDGEPVALDRHKALALLAYLAVTAQSHRRDSLATMFWEDFDQTRARAALRRALASLNKAIPGAWWDTDRETIALNLKTSSHFFLDTIQFHARLANCGTHGHPAAEVCPLCLAPLTEAVTLYRGDFLSGFTLRDSPAFDDWQFTQTESLRLELSGVLERLSRLHASCGEFELAIAHARRWLTLDPLNEPAHRQLMLLYAQSGYRHAALRQYAECVRVLERELGVPPQEETTQLYEAIKADQLPPTLPPHTQRIIESPRTNVISPQTSPALEKPTSPFERLVRGGLVGRELELERVKTIWGRVSAGESRVLLLSGEPGIGKSRLAREIVGMTRTSGAEVLECQCIPEDSAPYAPIAQIVRSALTNRESLPLSNQVLANLLTLTPDLALHYPNLPANQALDPQSAQRLLFESVASFMDSLTQKNRTPLLFFIEDVHWADTGTLFLLRHLARRANTKKLKLVILLTYRDAESDLDEARGLRDVLLDLNRENLADHIRLSRLNREYTNNMLALMLGAQGDISTEFSNAIFGETEGNPFFIEELCKALIESGDLYYAGGHWRRAEMESIKLPQNVRSTILSRVEKLPQEVQEVLRLAAILGREFDFETIKSASESDDAALQVTLERAERTQLIQKMERDENPAYTFVHALIPFALRESISGLRRQRMHARVAEALEGQRPDDVESLAYHFIAAGMRAKSVEYSRLSAQRAERMYAYNSAIRHLLVALEMLEAREDDLLHIALLEGLADLHYKINEGVHAIPIYLEALQLWRGSSNADRWTAVRLQRKVGEAAVYLNRFADHQRFAATARSSLEAGLALVQDQSPHPETIRLLCALSRDAWYVTSSADWNAAERYAQAAMAMAERLDLPEELSLALEALYFVYGARGMFRERVEVCLRRLDLSRGPGFTGYRERVDILYPLGRALYSVGEFESALSHAMETESLSAAIQDVSSQVTAMVLQSQCLYSLDRWDDLFSLNARLLEIRARNPIERMGASLWVHTALVSVLERFRGNREKADALREETCNMMIATAGPPEGWVRNHHYWYCHLLMAEGAFDFVREHGERALKLGSRGWVMIGDHELYSLLADAAAQQRDEAALQKYAPLAEEFASRYDHKLYRAIAHRAWGVSHRLAGQYAESQIRFDQALEIFQQMTARWQIGRTLFELGELAIARADNAAAREHFSRGLTAFEGIGALPDATRVRERLAVL